jgi:hypothetical protein
LGLEGKSLKPKKTKISKTLAHSTRGSAIMGKTKVEINFNIYCMRHGKPVKMIITQSDKEVPSYLAKCPRENCDTEIIFDFESMSIG